MYVHGAGCPAAGCWHWQSLPRGAPSSISLALSSPPTNNLTITPPSNSLNSTRSAKPNHFFFFHLSSLSLGPIRHLPTPSTEAPLSRLLFIRFPLNNPSSYYKFPRLKVRIYTSAQLNTSTCEQEPSPCPVAAISSSCCCLCLCFVVPFHHPLCRHCSPPQTETNTHPLSPLGSPGAFTTTIKR